MAYTQEQRKAAVDIIAQLGGLSNEAVSAVRAFLNAPGLSKSTMHGWLKDLSPRTEPNRTIEPNNRTKKIIPNAMPLDVMFENVARLYLEHAQLQGKIDKASAKDLLTAAAIAVDKMRLLRDLPTVIINAAPELTALGKFLEQHQIPASELFQGLLDDLQAQTNIEQDAESVDE